jgi:hypothetical protein
MKFVRFEAKNNGIASLRSSFLELAHISPN